MQSELENTQKEMQEMTRRAEAAERELAALRARGKNGEN
jgi:DNA-binding protein YbaB